MTRPALTAAIRSRSRSRRLFGEVETTAADSGCPRLNRAEPCVPSMARSPTSVADHGKMATRSGIAMTEVLVVEAGGCRLGASAVLL